MCGHHDHLSGANSVRIEWGMTPEEGGPYTPILYKEVNLQKHHSKRFNLRLTHADEVNCSLVISPVLQTNSGTYEVRLTVDSVQRQPFMKVIIHVTGKCYRFWFIVHSMGSSPAVGGGGLRRTRTRLGRYSLWVLMGYWVF